MAKEASLRERLIKQKAEIKSSQAGGKFFTIKEGTTRYRHLPVGAEREYAIEVIYIFLNKDLGAHICPSTWGKKSAFLEMKTKFENSKNEDDRKFAKEKLRLGKKFLSPVCKMKDENGKEVDESAGAKLLLMTPGLYQESIDLFLDTNEAGDFTDPDEGYDLKYSRTGKTLTDTEYSLRACKPTKLKKPFRGKEYDPIAMAKECTPTYEETKELMEKYLNSDLEEVEDDEPKSKKKKVKLDDDDDEPRPKKKKKPIEVDDDDDEDQGEVVIKKKKKKK